MSFFQHIMELNVIVHGVSKLFEFVILVSVEPLLAYAAYCSQFAQLEVVGHVVLLVALHHLHLEAMDVVQQAEFGHHVSQETLLLLTVQVFVESADVLVARGLIQGLLGFFMD